MDREPHESIIARLKELSDAELKYIYGKLIDNIETDIPLAITDEEIEEQTQKNSQFLQQVALELDVDSQPITSEKDGAINFLIVVAEIFPEYAQIIEQELIQLEQQPTKLGSGANSFVANILIIALATAIILPDVEIEHSLVTVGEEKQEETTKIKVEGTGMEDIAAVLKAALPFVSSK